ncbi:SDR family oxidoreductase [Actinoplanes sp. NPDC049118]|uniref:SDR family oxidoreductase n=1 Tax=Actinoplanes sp. NPDC049118 TaxID=3155769 RepID=UPI0033C9B276
MNQHRPTVLLSGASGVVGRALIDELTPDHDVICLYHRAPIDDPRVEVVQGDLTRADAGLERGELAALCDRLDVVLHCAANTKWNTPRDEIMNTNLGGTTRMLEIARRSGARMVHMSTAFVARDGAQADAAGGGVTAYVKSKVASENLVRDSGLPWTIVRPSVLIGDSRDGRIAAFQGIHKVIGATYRGTLPVLPADLDSMIDFVPQDVVARAVGRLIRDPQAGGEHWLTAGDQALRLTEMVELTLDLAELTGPRPHPPRMVPVEAVDRLLLPMLEDVLPVGIRRQFSAFAELMLLFQSRTAMPSSLPALGLGDEVSHAALCRAFRLSAEQLVNRRDRAARPAPAAVPAATATAVAG